MHNISIDQFLTNPVESGEIQSKINPYHVTIDSYWVLIIYVNATKIQTGKMGRILSEEFIA
jgi:hypothetical protein